MTAGMGHRVPGHVSGRSIPLQAISDRRSQLLFQPSRLLEEEASRSAATAHAGDFDLRITANGMLIYR